MRVLTLVATYNEVENIARLVPDIRKHLPGSSVLVVDDNSPDGTTEVVRRMGQYFDDVRVISRTNERGYGSATLVGLRYAIQHGYETVLTLDADYSHDPADLPRLVEALRSADVAIGSRYVHGVRVLNWDVRRLLLSLLANAYVRVLAGLQCVDCTSGFRAYRVDVLKRGALEKVRTNGYAFLPELLFGLEGANVKEVPICYTERRLGQSKMSRRVIVEAVVRPWVLLLRRFTRFVRRSLHSGNVAVHSHGEIRVESKTIATARPASEQQQPSTRSSSTVKP
jgi:dolichol-phosphate mannosyltransferase